MSVIPSCNYPCLLIAVSVRYLITCVSIATAQNYNFAFSYKNGLSDNNFHVIQLIHQMLHVLYIRLVTMQCTQHVNFVALVIIGCDQWTGISPYLTGIHKHGTIAVSTPCGII